VKGTDIFSNEVRLRFQSRGQDQPVDSKVNAVSSDYEPLCNASFIGQIEYSTVQDHGSIKV
jgi:hypothetical protein